MLKGAVKKEDFEFLVEFGSIQIASTSSVLPHLVYISGPFHTQRLTKDLLQNLPRR